MQINSFRNKVVMITGAASGLAAGSPMKRLGQPQEIVSVMLMLCAAENSYMNGQAIAVDGGVSAY
jgi:NAD(P)-dependent dehydrogenase (short-subunit alcohol dehydrogenase family)